MDNNMNPGNGGPQYQQPYNQGYPQPNPAYYDSAKYKPISVWGYLGYEILFGIPVIGFIMMLILAFAPENVNVKNFARSFLLWIFLVTLITAIVVLIVTLVTGVSIVGLVGAYNEAVSSSMYY